MPWTSRLDAARCCMIRPEPQPISSTKASLLGSAFQTTSARGRPETSNDSEVSRWAIASMASTEAASSQNLR
jgi:hypothetical protein